MTSVSPLVHGDMISWSKNIKSISAKANSLLGMIRRSIRFDAPSPDKFQLYVSHVRSILGYCSPLWSPSNVLERVQRHATKYILNNYSDMSYAERWIQVNIIPLCLCREIIDFVLFYKYLHNYVDCDFSSYFELVGSSHSLRSSNKGPLLKLLLNYDCPPSFLFLSQCAFVEFFASAYPWGK